MPTPTFGGLHSSYVIRVKGDEAKLVETLAHKCEITIPQAVAILIRVASHALLGHAEYVTAQRLSLEQMAVMVSTANGTTSPSRRHPVGKATEFPPTN